MVVLKNDDYKCDIMNVDISETKDNGILF